MQVVGELLDAEKASYQGDDAMSHRVQLINSSSVTWTLNPTDGTLQATAAGGPGGGISHLQAFGRSALGV
jgi:hypothetical protein